MWNLTNGDYSVLDLKTYTKWTSRLGKSSTLISTLSRYTPSQIMEIHNVLPTVV